ncbi:hypothetical protein [Gallionella capsiferriformans]|jgi:hypothetical protein|uniref:Uncharacterized protein n=1 Tax=Gallionella capsiferriformans (strain ES-2) TaxID=395494 RepID=D9SFH4_GALCS|nr:hypothetical protein [Gallionella capsiferriformans]ADL55271.1 hypothetical protein Galf_1243 [Gallionella capsiferriformans ES-2]
MYAVHDVDALLLLAIAISSKRRPAELAEIIAANDLIHGSVSLKSELTAGFKNLSSHGLIVQVDNGYTLTPVGLTLMSTGRKKADNEERLHGLKAAISAYKLKSDHPVIQLTDEQMAAAMHEHEASKALTGKNLLVPKPKPVVDAKRPLRRKPMPARRKF